MAAYYSLRYTGVERTALCKEWHAMDNGTTSLNLPACPTTAVLAEEDAAFEKDGLLAHTSFFHSGAEFCIRSMHEKVGRQQCCYSGDGHIMRGEPGEWIQKQSNF